MNIIENLNKYLQSSDQYMSSMSKENTRNKNFKNIAESLGSGTFTEMSIVLKLKYFFLQYLQKKIWGKEIFKTTYFEYYKNLCKQQNRLIDFDIIKHAFILKILDEKNLLKGKICSIGDGKANFVSGCLGLKKDTILYSVNLPQALIQDYLIIKKFNILDDNFIKVVNNEKDLDSKNIKLFLIPAQNKLYLNNQGINLFTNIVSFQEIPKSETKSYFDLIKNNKSFFYCCNQKQKLMYDGVLIKYYEYPWGDCEKIFEEECSFYKQYCTLRPPFIHDKKGKVIHSLTKFN